LKQFHPVVTKTVTIGRAVYEIPRRLLVRSLVVLALASGEPLVRFAPGRATIDQHKGCCSSRAAKIPCVTRHLRKIRAALEIPTYQTFYDGEAKPKKIKALNLGREGKSLSR
jgi:hypothetical protein